jgi:hypothetical protein
VSIKNPNGRVQNNLQFLRHWKSNRLSSQDVIGWFSRHHSVTIQSALRYFDTISRLQKCSDAKVSTVLNRNFFYFYYLRAE